MNRKTEDMKKASINDELDELSPLLRDLSRRDDGLQVPDGYFDAVEDSVFARIERAENRRKTVPEIRHGGLRGRFTRTQWMWAAAAALTLVMAATWFILPKPADTTIAVSQDLTEEEIEAYVLENIRDFDEALIADAPVSEYPATESKPVSPAEPQTKDNDPVDDLSEEELELLLKDMSDEELENLLKT